MTVLDRLLKKRDELVKDLHRVDARIVRNGGRSIFKPKEDNPPDRMTDDGK